MPISRSVPTTREQFLELFASYIGEEWIRQIKDELALTRTGGFRAPKKILIILFASRAGSNYLGQLLSRTGWFVEIGESFRPSQLNKIRERHRLSDNHQAAQWMIDHRGTDHAFGFKAGYTVLVAAAELGILPEILDRAELLLLRRHDRVAQAVSLVKGRLSGRMHSGQPMGRPLTDADYDRAAIAAEVGNIAETERQFSELVGRLGKSAPVVYYEDICAEPEKHVSDICGLLGLPMPEDYAPDVRLSILRDDLSARWVERFRTDCPEVR